MLVLAMEFSKVMRARRRRSLGAEQEQPDLPPSACAGFPETCSGHSTGQVRWKAE